MPKYNVYSPSIFMLFVLHMVVWQQAKQTGSVTKLFLVLPSILVQKSVFPPIQYLFGLNIPFLMILQILRNLPPFSKKTNTNTAICRMMMMKRNYVLIGIHAEKHAILIENKIIILMIPKSVCRVFWLSMLFSEEKNEIVDDRGYPKVWHGTERVKTEIWCS